MAAEVHSDLTQIQDEDILRRMWADTEDFGRKKEIRARMYKLREQRLKDFYTTGEVTSVNRKNQTTRHIESIGDQGFLTMKSKEIRDSESPTRDFSRAVISKNQDNNGYWTSRQETSHTTGTDDGALIQSSVESREGHGVVKGENSETKLALASVNQHQVLSKETDGFSLKAEELAQSSQMASVTESDTGVSSKTESQSVVQSKSEQKSSTETSQKTNWSSSSSTSSKRFVTSSTSHVVSGDSTHVKSITDGSNVQNNLRITNESETDYKSDQRVKSDDVRSENVRRSADSQRTENTQRFENVESNRSDFTTEESKRVTSQRSEKQEKQYVATSVVPQQITETSGIQQVETIVENKGRDVVDNVDVRYTPSNELTTRVEKTSQDNVVETNVSTDQKILTEIQKLDSYLSTHTPVASTPVSPRSVCDNSSWTVVTKDNRDNEFIYEEKPVREPKEQEPTQYQPREKMVKHPSNLDLPKEATEGQYVTTYQSHYTRPERISVDHTPSHDYFASTLRSSPDRSTPSPTKGRAPSRGSLDRSSPERKLRTTPVGRSTPESRRSTSKGSLDRSSPERKYRMSPSKTPDMERRGSSSSYTIERKTESRKTETKKTSDRSDTRPKRKFSSTQQKQANKTRVSTPGASPSASPTRKPEDMSGSDSDNSQATYNKDSRPVESDNMPRGKSPEYSSEGSITRELRRKNQEPSPERSAFTPIKNFRTGPETDKFIVEEKRAVSEDCTHVDISTENVTSLDKVQRKIVNSRQRTSPESSPDRSSPERSPVRKTPKSKVSETSKTTTDVKRTVKSTTEYKKPTPVQKTTMRPTKLSSPERVKPTRPETTSRQPQTSAKSPSKPDYTLKKKTTDITRKATSPIKKATEVKTTKVTTTTRKTYSTGRTPTTSTTTRVESRLTPRNSKDKIEIKSKPVAKTSPSSRVQPTRPVAKTPLKSTQGTPKPTGKTATPVAAKVSPARKPRIPDSPTKASQVRNTTLTRPLSSTPTTQRPLPKTQQTTTSKTTRTEVQKKTREFIDNENTSEIEDENPPDEFYADFDDEVEDLKSTDVTKKSTLRSNLKSQPLKKGRNTSSSSSSEDEAESPTQHQYDRLTANPDYLNVIVQHPKSSRESSPGYPSTGVPFSATSDDGESNPRYADFVSEPDDVEVFAPITERRRSIEYEVKPQTEDVDEEASKCVADKVNVFLEAARNTLEPHETQPVQIGSNKSVSKAKSLFENIAKTQTTTTTSKKPVNIQPSNVEVRQTQELIDEERQERVEEARRTIRKDTPVPKSLDHPQLKDEKKPFERKISSTNVDVNSRKDFFEKRANDTERRMKIDEENVLHGTATRADSSYIKSTIASTVRAQSPDKALVGGRRPSKDGPLENLRRPSQDDFPKENRRKPESVQKPTKPEEVNRRSSKPENRSSSPTKNISTRRTSKPDEVVTRRPSKPEYRSSSPTKSFSPTRRPSKPDEITRRPSKPEYRSSSPTKSFSPTRRPSKPDEITRRPSKPEYRSSSPTKSFSPTRRPSKPDEITRRPSKPDETVRRPSKPDYRSPSPTKSYSPTRTSSKPEEITRRPSQPEYRSPSPGKSSSPTRRPSKPEDQRQSLKSNSIFKNETTVKTEKFGVTLKKTPSSNGITPVPVKSTPRKPSAGELLINIEEIFDLELLEELLIKATAYEERRRIRSQIRLVKKQLEEEHNRSGSSSVITSVRDLKFNKPKELSRTEEKTVKSSRFEERNVFKRDEKPSTRSSSSETRTTTTETKFHTRDSPERKYSGQPSFEKKSPKGRESPERKTPRSSPERRIVRKDSAETQFTNGETTYQTTVRTQTVRKVTSTSVGSTTDSITSSYGVGPIDDNGRPLFGLRALRRNNTNKSISGEEVVSEQEEARRDSYTTEERRQSNTTEERRQSYTSEERRQSYTSEEILDSNGRPLFGGLKALQSDNMPAQTTQLRELVERHQALVAKETEKDVQPLQKPKAKLRDSFILQAQEEEALKTALAALPTTDDAASRGLSLKSIIKKHENASTGNVRSHMESTSTVSTSHSSTTSDGKVFMKKDVIRGEISARNGEEPSGKITQSTYSYRKDDRESVPSVKSATRTALIGQRRLSGPQIEEITDESSSSSIRRYSKEYTVDEDSTARNETRRRSSGLNEDNVKAFTSILKNRDENSRRSSGQIDESEKSLKSSFSTKTTSISSQRETSDETSKKSLTRGDSVKALQHKYQQATEAANQQSPSRSYPKAGLILRSNSLQGADDVPNFSSGLKSATVRSDRDSSVVTSSQAKTFDDAKKVKSNESTVTEVTRKTVGSSFLDNTSKVTGVQDILTRMRNADLGSETTESSEDAEARALLNKFLGASVILQGMEQGMKAANSSAAALVSQAEKQRVKATNTRTQEDDVDEITDEKQLKILLDACSDYEGRRKIRARLREVMADSKGGSGPAGSSFEGECGHRMTNSGGFDDSGTESGEDLRHLNPEVVEEVKSALSRLEGVIPGLDPTKREAVTQLVSSLQTCLRMAMPQPPPPVPPPRRFGSKRALRNRHTVGVTNEELVLARKWMDEDNMQRGVSGSNESLAAKVFRPVKFTPPAPVPEARYTKHSLTRKLFYKPIVHSVGYFMEPAPLKAVLSHVAVEPSAIDYDPSVHLFTPEQTVQIAVHKAAIKKQISREEKRRDGSEDGDVSSADEDSCEMSSAARLLQMATESDKKQRLANRSMKKLKMKRANTIDIPKSKIYDYSSDDYGASADETRDDMGKRHGANPPSFQPKTENDHKFLAFLKQVNDNSTSKVLSYNPSARGGKHWQSRFSTIKTTFEDAEPKLPTNYSPSPAKLFWQNQRDDVKVKPASPAKLPWTVKAGEDGVVVGSLTVAKPGHINHFNHAPKSAFKPIDQKPTTPGSTVSGSVKQIAAQKFSVAASDPKKTEPKKVSVPYKNGTTFTVAEPPKKMEKPSAFIPYSQPKTIKPFDMTKMVSKPIYETQPLKKYEYPTRFSPSRPEPPIRPPKVVVNAKYPIFPPENAQPRVPEVKDYSHFNYEPELSHEVQNLTIRDTRVLERHDESFSNLVNGQYLCNLRDASTINTDGEFVSNIPATSPGLRDSRYISPNPVIKPRLDQNEERTAPLSDTFVTSPLNGFENGHVSPLAETPHMLSPQFLPKSPEVQDDGECKAITRVMGQAQCQTAVTVNRTRRRGQDEDKADLRHQLALSARTKTLSPTFPNVLQKSESWHQMVKEQMQQARQAPPLPKISKAKSSHALALPRQFEAPQTGDVTHKKITVSQYMAKHRRPQAQRHKSLGNISNLDDEDLDNVDEAFETIFQESNRKRRSK